MSRTLSIFLVTVVVAACVAPATANATAAITDGSGTLLPVGTGLLGNSTNAVTHTSLGDFTCAEMEFEGEISSNTGSSFHVVGILWGETNSCDIEGTEVAVVSFELRSLSSLSSVSGTANISLEALLPGVRCAFEGLVSYSHKSGSNAITFTEANLLGVPKACEPGFFSAQFTLSQGSGGAVVLD